MSEQNTKIEVGLPGPDYWKELISCQAACPVRTDSRGYVRAIADGNYELAYLIARSPNPFASVCGLICGAPCEAACRRGVIDEPISIRALKRFVTNLFGPESPNAPRNTLLHVLRGAEHQQGSPICSGKNDVLPMLQSIQNGDIQRVKDNKVAIIGSGPSGLTAAHDLALLGFKCTVYEMESELGGMLAYGVPVYRLPREILKAEIQTILDMGVETVTNCMVGKDITFDELHQQYDAIIIACGARKSRKIPLPGIEGKGVFGGVEFLNEVMNDKEVPTEKKAVVIGGGDVAFDVARTAIRKGCEEVNLVCLETREEMPADEMEIEAGSQEGVIIQNSYGPREIVLDNDNQVTGIIFRRCTRTFDEDGKFNPQFEESDVIEFKCDNVFLTVGQVFDLEFIKQQDDTNTQQQDSEYQGDQVYLTVGQANDLDFIKKKKSGAKLNERNLIEADSVTGATEDEKVFVVGDLATGPQLVITSVASGKEVARSVYQYITGNEIQFDATDLHFPIADFQREANYETIGRKSLPMEDSQKRKSSLSLMVDRGYDENQARCEASRCLDCGVNTIFDGNKCILCGGCADICPEDCLSYCATNNITGEQELVSVIKHSLGSFPDHESASIIKDETRCIRCALCAERCPTGAITMEQYKFKEVISGR